MSLHLATKGTLDSGVTQATKGMIYYSGIVRAIKVLPQLIVRRLSFDRIVRRISVSKIVRREDA